jgi:hypothetical protein
MGFIQIILSPVNETRIITCLVHVQGDIGMVGSVLIKKRKKQRASVDKQANRSDKKFNAVINP